MSTSALRPVTPRRTSSIPTNDTSFPSPTKGLVDALANIRLDDQILGEESGSDHDERSLADLLQAISSQLANIKDHFFTIQERRHAGVFALEESRRNGDLTSTPTQSEKDGAARNIALDVAMAELNSMLELTSELFIAAERALDQTDIRGSGGHRQEGMPPRQRTASISSISSLDSFDGAFLRLSASTTPSILKKSFQELSREWVQVQAEAKVLDDELSADKYLVIFTSVCGQLEEMMDSLDKALASCHDVVFAYHRERAERALRAHAGPSVSDAGSSAQVFKQVKRSFDVKKTSYGPACEQLFHSLEKGVAQRTTHHGSITRRYSDLKARWDAVRERVTKTDNDLKRVEAELAEEADREKGGNTRGPNRNSLLTPAHERGAKSGLRGKSGTATKTPTGMSRSISREELQMGAASPTPASRRQAGPQEVATPNPTKSSPPLKPPKSIHRMSALDMAQRRPSQQQHSRSVSDAANTAALQKPRLSSLTAPPSSFHRYGSISPSRSENGQMSSQQETQPIWTGRFEPNGTAPLRIGSAAGRGDSSVILSSDETVEEITVQDAGRFQGRPASASGMYSRPASSAGSYYRPPTSNGMHDESFSTRIPRLANATPRRNAHDSSFNGSDISNRPGSAMSYSSATAYGKSPSAQSTSSRGQRPLSSYYQQDRGNRLSMQTPEPTIAARAQRMSLFAPKISSTNSSSATSTQKRSSRPPPSKLNASVYRPFGTSGLQAPSSPSGASGASSVAASPSRYRSPAPTEPLMINKRTTNNWTANGRTTPLSAAALAKVPNLRPEQGHESVYRVASQEGSVSTSVSNFRSQQRSAAGSTSASQYERGMVGRYASSAVSGRETPTYSEGGASSVWGGHTSRRLVHDYAYKANPNDAIDVEVASVVNSLGVAIERVDPPLPRGVKDLTPSSSKTVKYEIGGKTVVCKLLQLHRPASVSANDTKTNKVLTRVGGGWIDLRQYLLSRLGTA